MQKIFLFLSFFVPLLCFIAYFKALSDVKVVKVSINVSNWHKSNNDLKIAVLADLHIGSLGFNLNKLKQIVELTNEQKPDIVFLLGDYLVNKGPLKKQIMPEPIANELKNLRAHYGVIAILGNHDWWVDGERVRKTFEDNGIIVLENQSIKVNNGKGSFWVAGLADLTTRKVDIEGTLAEINDESPIILLSHNPDVFPQVPERVTLTLAGHTHGGQVKLPIFGRPFVPSKYNEQYAYGHIVKGNKNLFISAGLGNSIVPIRIATKPEIIILNLEEKK